MFDKIELSKFLKVGEINLPNKKKGLELVFTDLVDNESGVVRSSVNVELLELLKNAEGKDTIPVHQVTVKLSPETVAALRSYFGGFLIGTQSVELEPEDDGV